MNFFYKIITFLSKKIEPKKNQEDESQLDQIVDKLISTKKIEDICILIDKNYIFSKKNFDKFIHFFINEQNDIKNNIAACTKIINYINDNSQSHKHIFKYYSENISLFLFPNEDNLIQLSQQINGVTVNLNLNSEEKQNLTFGFAIIKLFKQNVIKNDLHHILKLIELSEKYSAKMESISLSSNTNLTSKKISESLIPYFKTINQILNNYYENIKNKSFINFESDISVNDFKFNLSFEEKNKIPNESLKIIKKIHNNFNKIAELDLNETEQFNVSKMYFEMIPRIIHEYLNINDSLRTTIKDKNGNSPLILMNNNLNEINSFLEITYKKQFIDQAEHSLIELNIQNRYLQNIKTNSN